MSANNSVLQRLKSEFIKRFGWITNPISALVVLAGAVVAALFAAAVQIPLDRATTPPAPTTTAPATEHRPPQPIGPRLAVQIFRMHPSALYYDPPAIPLTDDDAEEVEEPSIFDGDPDRASCFTANKRFDAYRLAMRLWRHRWANRRVGDRERALEVLDLVRQSAQLSSTADRRDAQFVRDLLSALRPATGPTVSETLVLTGEMLNADDAEIYLNPENAFDLPADASAVFDVVLVNTGDANAIVSAAKFETITIFAEGIAGGGDDETTYPLETFSTLTFNLADDRPVELPDPIVIPPGETVRFNFDVTPDGDGQFLEMAIHAWEGRVHFLSGTTQLTATPSVCVVLPSPMW